jgi:ABC-type lipoprotein release transport system permease subunit
VAAATSRVVVSGAASTARKSLGVLIHSIEPHNEAAILRLSETFPDSSHTWFTTHVRRPVVIGKQLADKLKLELGDKLRLTTQGHDGYTTEGKFKIVGIFQADNARFNESTVFVLQSDFEGIANYSPQMAHEIVVRLHHRDDAPALAKRLKALRPDLQVDTYLELAPDVALVANYLDVYLMMIVGIILLALGFGIVNTMLMVVLERVRELGMLMAIGMNRARVFGMVMLETLFLMATGAVVGMSLSFALILHFGEVGIDISSYAQGFSAIGFSSVLRPEIGLLHYLKISALVLLTGVIASIYPALKAIRLKPAEAIRSL